MTIINQYLFKFTFRSLLSLFAISIMLSPLQANAFWGCSSQAKKLAVSSYGGKAHSAYHSGNGRWSVTLVYSDGGFSSVTVYPGCE